MYYLITKEQADLLGVFNYDVDKIFDPYTIFGNGKYYVSKSMVDLLAEHEKISLIDWNEIETSQNVIVINKPDFTS